VLVSIITERRRKGRERARRAMQMTYLLVFWPEKKLQEHQGNMHDQ
jgi:hypothetical protein